MPARATQPEPESPQPSPQPMTRRELRARRVAAEAEAARRPAAPDPAVSRWTSSTTTDAAPQPVTAPKRGPEPAPQLGLIWEQAGDGGGGRGRPPKRSGRARRAWTWIISTLVILALVGGGTVFAWHTFQPQVQSVMKHFDKAPVDYTGTGTGSVDITIKDGDTGESIAVTLQQAGVTRTAQAFYQLLLQTSPSPVFQPGVYRLKKHMSAANALALLQTPSARLERTLLIKEGESESAVLAAAATATKIPLAQLKAAAAHPAAYGLPSQATTLEGFLFPATYTFNPGVSAKTLISTLVNRAKQAFEDDGVPSNKLWNTVILASIIQREAGSNPSDLPKIAGVFTNRINQGMRLQSDATVAYGTGHTDTVWTTQKQRDDTSNPYNTYAHDGLPVGPIGNPGDAALKAALHPSGSYLYFTVVNLQTGETAFATTEADHEKNVAKLQSWCAQTANKAYCS